VFIRSNLSNVRLLNFAIQVDTANWSRCGTFPVRATCFVCGLIAGEAKPRSISTACKPPPADSIAAGRRPALLTVRIGVGKKLIERSGYHRVLRLAGEMAERLKAHAWKA